MKFRKLKVKILSEGQWYGFEYEFLPGLNIIRGDNSSGKSTLVNSLIYSIGMEELIGSKGPSSLPYALRTHFELDDKEYINVESYTLVELENSKGEVKTFKRYISSKDKDSKLVQIIHGDYLTQNESGSFNSSPVYLHDPNSATNEEFGFFATFEKFLGLELPNIADNKGYNRKLYLQYIFAALLIEQKRGWTNYIANTPYFGVSNVVQKTVSYLLNLDTFDKES
ncbi:AAA family ATPase [Vibrio cholerae]|nr:AAA family ATPase [Vibrio cholerae]